MDLNLTFMQPDIFWQDAPANRRHYEQLLDQTPNESRLVVLPEMFATGFTVHPEHVAEEMNGGTAHWMREQAHRLDAVICGSVAIREDGFCYNRLIWMRPDGSFDQYDKRHLFSLAGEQKTFTPGNERLIVTIDEWTICPQVCYDLRFPVWSRNTEDYDLYINVANWPDRRIKAWQTLLMARAIENQVYVLGVNRVGEDGNGIYHSGNSALIDPVGEIVEQISDVEAVQTVTLSRERLQKARRKFPFLKDRDPFSLEL